MDWKDLTVLLLRIATIGLFSIAVLLGFFIGKIF